MYNRNVLTLSTVGSEELDQYYSERTIKGWCTVMSLIEADILSKIPGALRPK